MLHCVRTAFSYFPHASLLKTITSLCHIKLHQTK